MNNDNKVSSVNANIYASVSTEIVLDAGETVDDVKSRFVDIYLHGAGENGHINKEDLGADSFRIEIEGADEKVFVNKGLLLALIDTVKRTTDLKGVYDEQCKTYYDWTALPKLIEGIPHADIESLIPPTHEL